jgi:pilus assembly protein CpaF
MKKQDWDSIASEVETNLPELATKLDSNGMSYALQHILQETQREISILTDGNDKDVLLSSEVLEAILKKVSERLGFSLSAYERDQVLQYLENDTNPFGILQPLINDSAVSDIIVAGYNSIVVQQGRKNYKTSLKFANQQAYSAFVERLLTKASSTYSTKKPIADGMIGSFARIHAVHESIAENGPYLTIRLNRFSTVSLADLEQKGLAAKNVLDYLEALVKIGKTILIVGEVGTGKTTLARALATTISHTESILVIEDTPEIKLSHPLVRYLHTREANSDGAGRVTPAECIRGGMRMAMNRIIFGEMRDAEAAESFVDVCASGHPGLSTIHGKSALDAVARLELFLGRAQKGVAQNVLQSQISTAVQAVVHIDICKFTGQRRVLEVVEIGSVADGVLRHKTIFKYLIKDGSPAWEVVNRTSNHRDALESYAKFELSQLPRFSIISDHLQFRESQKLAYQ